MTRELPEPRGTDGARLTERQRRRGPRYGGPGRPHSRLLSFLLLMVMVTTVAAFASNNAFAANPSANLDQCANDPAPSLTTDGCDTDPSQWVNGNLGASKSVYAEGESVPYRMRFDNLATTGSHNVTIEWDTTKGNKHALDYLTSVTDSVLTANPCLGVTGCSTYSTYPIPPDPQVTGEGVTPRAGEFRLYGGTITGVSAYSYAQGTGFTGDKVAAITITFTASVANPVLAWGGHIASRADWGPDNAAVAIPGSPYHMRLMDLDGRGGNQDRSLSAEAVIFPGSITVIKDAIPDGETTFSFTGAPAPLTDFTLVDNGTASNTKTFSNITTFQTYTINETPIPSGWNFTSVACAVTSPNGGSYDTNTTTVAVAMNEGENWTCTYVDSQQQGTLTVIKKVVNDNGGSATASAWSMHVTSGATDVTGSPQPGSETGTSYTLAPGSYNVSETGGPSGYTMTGYSGDCDASGNVTVVAGQSKTCTLTNDDQQAFVIVEKVVINDNGGSAAPDDFKLTLDSVATTSGTKVPVNPGSHTAAETQLSGYTFTGFSGDCDSNGAVTVALGETKTCTPTNDDQQAYVIVEKVVINDNGGSALPDDFKLTLDGTGTTSGTKVPVNPGSHTAAETQLSGYTFTGFSGDCDSNGAVTVALGETKTCTLTNDDQQAYVIVTKVLRNGNGAVADPDDFKLTLSGVPTTSGTAVPVNPGTYTAGETTFDPWFFDSFSGDCDANGNVTLALGETKTCTLTNYDPPPSLEITKTANPAGPVSAGDLIGFDITVKNLGPGPARDVTITDTLPVGLTWSVDPAVTGCSISSGVLTCNAGELAVMASSSVRITATSTAEVCGTISNTARAEASNNGSVEASASVVADCPDVTVTKTAAASPIVSGATASFTMTVTNLGPGTARNVTLNDPLPAGISWTLNPAVTGCSITANVLSCSWESLAPSASISITVSGVTTSANCGTLTNTVTVAATNEPSTATGNNTATASIVVICTQGNIFATQTTCQDFLQGTALELSLVQYGVRGGKINSTAPGVFFWYGKYSGAALASGVTISQSASPSGIPLFQTQKSQIVLYDSNCNRINGIEVTGNGAPSITITESGLMASAEYVLSIKYSTAAPVGYPVSTPYPTWVYTLSDSAGISDALTLEPNRTTLPPSFGNTGRMINWALQQLSAVNANSMQSP